jgi:hypothetical protein
VRSAPTMLRKLLKFCNSEKHIPTGFAGSARARTPVPLCLFVHIKREVREAGEANQTRRGRSVTLKSIRHLTSNEKRSELS